MSSYFPGWWALLPSLSAFFIISAGPNTFLNKKLLDNKLMLWVGLISYPLYLWHWPILSYLRIVVGDTSQLERVGAVLVTAVLSWLTYTFIEKPFRFGKNPRVKSTYLLTIMLLVLIIGVITFLSNGFKDVNRLSQEKSEYLSYFNNSLPEWNFFETKNMAQKYRFDCDFYDLNKYKIGQNTMVPIPSINKSCFTQDVTRSHSVLIWGDSHAQMLYYGIKNNLPDNWQVLTGFSSGCRPDPNIINSSSTNYCQQSNWFTIQTITDVKPDVVIVAQAGLHSITKMEDVTNKLQLMGVKKIIFTGPSPHWKPDLPKLVVRSLWNNTPKRSKVGRDKHKIKANNQLKEEFKLQPNVTFISLIDYFCNDTGCLIYIGDDKKFGLTSWDYGHLTPMASDLVAKELLVKEIIAPIE